METVARILSPSEGVASGAEPLENELELYLVQIVLIVIICQLLGSILVKFNQPRVIAEIIGGIMLGPSFLGRIPGFTDKVFPDEHMPALKLTATLGLVLFLFIVGLELDPSLLRMNAKRSLMISIGGQSFTWAISILLAYLMYENIDDLDVSFPLFMLFIGVAMSVTAFPVLSRILTEGRLLNSKVGSATIGSAAFDDITAWSMLALVISLVNAGEPQQAAYVLLLMIAFVILMLTGGRYLAAYLVNKFGVGHGLNRGIVCISLVCVLVCGWFTQMVGVDAIFGAFLMGLIMPRDGTLAVELTEKVEDVVTVLLLPLYFAVSGLKTDFSALDSGKSWGFVILIISGACVGKITGCGTAARLGGLSKRESVTVGILMNTRGLVEIIILNAGLDAGVINQEVFAIMVLMAVTTTCMTSPLAACIYPPHMRIEEGPYKKLEVGETHPVQKQSLYDIVSHLDSYKSLDQFALDMLSQIKLLVCLPGHGVRALASSMAAVQLLRREGAELHAVRVLELSDRFSSDMAATNVNRTLTGDSVMGAFISFCGGGVRLTAHMVLAAPTDLHLDVLALAQRLNTNTVMIGWEPPQQPRWPKAEEFASPAQALVEGLFNQSAAHGTSVAVAVDRGALAQAPSTILVPIASFSHCEVEALLLAMVMAIQSKAELIVMVLGISSLDGIMEEPVKPASAVLASAIDKKDDTETSQQSTRQWQNGQGHKQDHPHERSLTQNSNIQIEDNEAQEAAGRVILSAASNLGVKIVQVPSEVSPRSQVEALLARMRADQKTVTTPALAFGGPTEGSNYPLVVCGRHSCGRGLPEYKSILGFIGGEINDAFPATSLVVVHSATGAIHRQEADGSHAAQSNFFERNINKSQYRQPAGTSSMDPNRHIGLEAQISV